MNNKTIKYRGRHTKDGKIYYTHKEGEKEKAERIKTECVDKIREKYLPGGITGTPF